MRLETPLGPDFVPDLRVVERAKREDLQQPINYQAGLTALVSCVFVLCAPQSITTQCINWRHPLQAVTSVQWGD